MKTTMMPNHNSPDTEVVDIISSLPESIRNHIVSFLPMVDAIRTSILSKPWRDVFFSLSNLDFDQHLFEEMPGKRINFTKFVSQVIDHLDGSNVESFKLSIVFDNSIVRHIHSWISYVLQHNVKELKVFVVSGKLDFLPCSLFTSRTLTVLCLSDILLELPTVIVFPMLKLLEFERVSWSDVEETYRLISSCPLLESLILIRCDWWSSNILVISAPNLKRLVLEPAPSPKEVRISCPNLYEIRYLGPQPDISSDTLSSLVIAKLNVFPFKPFKESIEILIGLQNVVQLTISESTLEILSRVRNLFSNNLLALNAVKNLDLTVFTTENQVQFVAFLLTIFPNIQTLTIAFEEPGRFACFLNMEAHRQPLNVSDLGALKHIEIREIKGNDNELDLVRHLLENAKNLVIMKINYSKDLDEDESMKNVIGEKIKKFVTASPDAVIAFV